ncbi:chemotaxis protein CheB [Pendulispora albinea]|uniref:protein-glutamate methylesterase n=1 Tax=Pendulispora albinea TaxID=2741071 RepID=A0ABZ2LRU2_9BACT
MITHDLVVIGGSAGSLEPLRTIVGALGGFRGTVLIAVHAYPNARSHLLPGLLASLGTLSVTHARDGDPLAPGTVLVAPPARHLIVEPGRVRLTTGPRENGTRPAIDPLFRTAARSYGARVVGVLLSGHLDDGTYGLAIIKSHGGRTIVQKPSTARHPDMPESGMHNVRVDAVLSPEEIGPRLCELANTPIMEETTMGRLGSKGAPLDRIAHDEGIAGERHATVLSCPECHGVMMRLERPDLLHFECQIGHAASPLSLEAAQATEVTGSLESARRGLREQALLAYMMAERARGNRDIEGAAELEERAHAYEKNADAIEGILSKVQRFGHGRAPNDGDLPG